MKKIHLTLFILTLIICCSFQDSANIWSILKSVQYQTISDPDNSNNLFFKLKPLKNDKILAIDGTTITLKGYFHNIPGAPKIYNKILFSQHDNWNRDCAVDMPKNYTLELFRTADYKVYYNRPCIIQGTLKMNWESDSGHYNQLTEVRCLRCE